MSARYKALLGAEIYRDGGSIEVRFSRSDGGYETIWLQVGDSPEGIFVPTELLVYANAERQGAGTRIAKHSAEEEALVGALHAFLSCPKVEVPFARRTQDAHFLETLETLLVNISKRLNQEE